MEHKRGKGYVFCQRNRESLPLISVHLLPEVLVGAAALLLVMMLISGHGYWLGAVPAAANWALLAACGVNMVVAVLFFEIIRRAGPVFFAQFNYLAVLAGIGWGWLVFSETLNPMVWVAFVLMAAGVIMISLKPRASEQVEPT
jgi:drug/metabolite transporter (DMT)-like permease